MSSFDLLAVISTSLSVTKFLNTYAQPAFSVLVVDSGAHEELHTLNSSSYKD